MIIEIGSKWVKDGEVVEVKALTSSILVEVVWYSKNDKKEHVITKDDFLEQYKPYEPVYEYQWAYKRATDSKWSISDIFYLYTPYLTRDKAEYQRLDFTKRERKC